MSENKNEQPQAAQTEQELNELLQIRRDKLAKLQEAGKDPFAITTCPRDHYAQEIRDQFETLENQDVCIAGRVMSWRDMGKASFLDIHDKTGRMQVYVKIDEVGEETYKEMKACWDLGDIISVSGFVFKTRRGEISVHAKEIKLLSKSLLPLPEKFHGLKDTDLRYRQRYVDLIVNPEVKDTFVRRSQIVTEIRNFLNEKGFLEVETPVLHTIAGGASARPFITHHNTLDMDMYLRIALELYLKRLIVGGFDKVYELGRCFRNEGMDTRHNPEFTMLELYQAYTDYNGMMDLTENLIRHCAMKACGTLDITYQGEKLSFAGPWERLPMTEAVKRYVGMDFDSEPLGALIAEANAKGLEMPADTTWGKALYEVFDNFVEDKLTGPVFITDYPVEVSPLAKKKPTDHRLTERFELFIACKELANAFSELNDPIDQRERFAAQMEAKAKGDEEAQPYDEDFITALEYGMPPTGGMGMGVDRLVMLLTDSYTIREVLLFPTMKPRA